VIIAILARSRDESASCAALSLVGGTAHNIDPEQSDRAPGRAEMAFRVEETDVRRQDL
jgi:hypothetical protein